MNENVEVHSNHTLIRANKEGDVTFLNSKTNRYINEHFDLLIGADGAYSSVRESMLQQGRVNFTREYIKHGYKELHIPPRYDKFGEPQYALPDVHGLHIWPRKEFMLIALPNADKSFTATLFAPYSGVDGFNSIDVNNDNQIMDYFKRHFPDVIEYIPTLVQDFRLNPVGSLVTVRTDPWNVGNILLIGDAAHAVVPFYGQGMNAAFEDCLLLYQNVIQCSYDLQEAIKQFQVDRIPAANALAELCLEHYHDMAANTTSSAYLLYRRMEENVLSLVPFGRFRSLYSMVSFSDIPYHIAVKKAALQDRMLTYFKIGNFSFLTFAMSVAAYQRYGDPLYLQRILREIMESPVFQNSIKYLLNYFRGFRSLRGI